jgi:myo-inositol-1(or 4)-monophosphatase
VVIIVKADILELARGVAFRSAREAGSILKDNFGKPYWVRDKSPGDALTEIDLRAEEAILGILRKEFPEHGILAEESGESETRSDYMWVVDPLDGTTNYSINNPFFCVSISLAFRNEVVLAVTYAPMSGELFHAVKGGGAFLNGKQVRVSGEGNLSRVLLSFCNGKSREDREEIGRIFSALKPVSRDFDRYKAGALELAFVAAGRFGAYLANSQMSWDSAAGDLLVREAGGKVTDFEGRPWNIRSPDILASNGEVHGEILETLKRIRNES